MITYNKLMKLSWPLLLTFSFFFTTCFCQHGLTSYCGKIQIQPPFSYPLNRRLICRSEKLYLRTCLGLFPVSSVDYATKTLTISHPSCASRYYVSPLLLSAGFPPLNPISFHLLNCSNSSVIRNCSCLNGACTTTDDSIAQEKVVEVSYSCLLVLSHPEKLDKGFPPKDLSCSHHRNLHTSSLNHDEGYDQLETRISFDIPNHVPDLCRECEKANGNCGVGLRCLCHPQECKDKVVSAAGSVKPSLDAFLTLLSFFTVLILTYIRF